MKRLCILFVLASASLTSARAQAAVSVDTYTFNNNLNALEAGAPALTAVDPNSVGTFGTATVFGNSHTVYNFNAPINSAAANQNGLSFLNTTAGHTVTSNNYSLEMVLSLQQVSTYARILDSVNRTSDTGLYAVNSGLFVYNSGPGTPSSSFPANTFHHLVATVASDNTVKLYLDGAAAVSATNTELDINGANLLNFFLDNNVGGFQNDYSPGSVALIRLFDSVLSDSDVTALNADPFANLPSGVPEPASIAIWSVVGLLSLVGFTWRKRRTV